MAFFSAPVEERRLVVVTEGRYQGTLGYEVDPEDEALFGHAYSEHIPDATIFEVGPWPEEVLIVRVYPEILQAEALPDNGKDGKIWQER